MYAIIHIHVIVYICLPVYTKRYACTQFHLTLSCIIRVPCVTDFFPSLLIYSNDKSFYSCLKMVSGNQNFVPSITPSNILYCP